MASPVNPTSAEPVAPKESPGAELDLSPILLRFQEANATLRLFRRGLGYAPDMHHARLLSWEDIPALLAEVQRLRALSLSFSAATPAPEPHLGEGGEGVGRKLPSSE